MAFKDIIGQAGPIGILRSHLESDHLGNAYLLAGPDGVGKKLVAQTLAKAVNCKEGPLDSCDRCPSCLKINNSRHPDVHVVDEQDSEIKIESIRQLQGQISLRPYEGKKKVFIINNAHNLNTASSNAFLKTLEEGSGESLIILVSDRSALLLKTIISRCRIIKFFPLKRDETKRVLESQYGLQNSLSHYLAYFCEGRIGGALRLKDSDIMPEKNRIIDDFISVPGRGFSSSTGQKREDLRKSLNVLASWFRDIYMLKAEMPESGLINLDRKTDLLNLLPRFSFSDLDNILNSVSDSLFYLESNVNIKLLKSNIKVNLWTD